MKIIDNNGREREVRSVRRITNYIPDRINGGTIKEELVEVIIQGKVRTWPNWYNLQKFKQMNPGVKI